MARASDEFRAAWDSLAGDEESGVGWRTIPIESSGSIALRAGRRFPHGEESLLASFGAAALPAGEKLPDAQGFAVERVEPGVDGRTWLALTRRSSGSPELFLAMARDVAGALDAEVAADPARLQRVFLGRVRAWQEFMRKGAQPLSAEAEIGLVGELMVLAAIIGAGVPAAMACAAWRGPLGGVRDFEIGTGGIEAKTTLSATGFPARIGSLEQLDDSARQPLYVAGVRLRQGPLGRGLPDWVETLRDIARGELEAESLLDERIVAAGYFDAHEESYVRRFEAGGMRLVVVGPGFPRITPGSAPEGILWATYEIDLDRAPGPSATVEHMLKRLGAL